MKKLLILITALLLLGSVQIVLAAPSPNSGQCPGATDPANTKIDTNNGSIVLDAGTIFCVHASNNNTGILVADGISTLDDYIAAHILNNGGQIPGISNYVIYSSAPSKNPSVAPSVTPSENASPTPSQSATESPSVTPSGPDSGGGPDLTPPPTDTQSTGYIPDSPARFLIILLITIGVVGIALLGLRERLNKP